MEKLNKIIKSKVFIINFFLIIILIGIVLFFILNHEKKEIIKENYIAYITLADENVLKLNIEKEYYECKKLTKKYICSDIVNSIKNYELMEDNIIPENLIKGSIEDAIENYINYINENNLEIKNIIITTNYKFDDKFTTEIKEKNKNVFFEYDKDVKDDELKTVYYTVNYDSNGGSSIDSVVVKDGEKAPIPNGPIRDKYKFIGWYLNDEEYNFETPISEDITLAAKWEKNVESSNNENSSSNNDNSSISKINLNDNLNATVYYEDTGNKTCFFYMFIDNLQEIYPNAKITNYSKTIKRASYSPFEEKEEYELSDTDLANSNLKINTSKEEDLKNVFKKYQNTSGINIDNFEIIDHRIYFTYSYITFNGLNIADGTKANQEITSALSNSILFQGPCGDSNYYENVTVDEEICEEFNLECGRW